MPFLRPKTLQRHSRSVTVNRIDDDLFLQPRAFSFTADYERERNKLALSSSIADGEMRSAASGGHCPSRSGLAIHLEIGC